jgi:hypothetical protein
LLELTEVEESLNHARSITKRHQQLGARKLVLNSSKARFLSISVLRYILKGTK